MLPSTRESRSVRSLRLLPVAALIGLLLTAGGSPIGGRLELAAQTPKTWYVSPDGLHNNPGTINAPMSLAKALSETSPAAPGDTIWLRGGVYNGAFVSYLRGTPTSPIVVRQFPGERATIDSNGSSAAALYVNGAHTWFWGFEIRSTDTMRFSSAAHSADLRRGAGVTSHAPGAKYINLVVHDMRIGIELWISSPDVEAYGNLIYHNGWMAPDRGHGHGIYSQNRDGIQSITDTSCSADSATASTRMDRTRPT
jgi:hypothetical protein